MSSSRLPRRCLREHLTQKADRAGTVQPGEKKAQDWILSMCINGLGGAKMTELDSSQWCPVKGREAMGTN